MSVRNITTDVMDEELEKRNGQEQAEQFTNKFDPKNYLNDRLEENELHKEIRVRVLPISKDSNSPFKVYKTHLLKVDTKISNSGLKRYICLSENDDIDHEKFGNECPCCKLREYEFQQANKATNDVDKERHKKNAKNFYTGDTCAMRLIERGHEEDGPKFWQFQVRSDGKDPMNVIKNLYKTRKNESIVEAKEENGGELPQDFVPENILDLYEGKDLLITIDAVFDKQGKKSRSITITDYGKNKPLSRNEEEIERWVNDPKDVYDVFTVKPYEYLEIAAKGKVPYFDKKKKVWVEWVERDKFDQEKVYVEDGFNDDIRKAEDEAKASVLRNQVIVNDDDEDNIPY